MADEQKWVPDPPFGLHGPTADNAPGSIFDPTIRKAAREVLAPALVATLKFLFSQLLAGNVTRPPEGLPLPSLPTPPSPPCPRLPIPPIPGMPAAGDGGNTATTQSAVSALQAAARPIQRAAGTGMFPHGDVDLSFITPNVVAPDAPRSGQGRQFYFLKKPNVPGGG